MVNYWGLIIILIIFILPPILLVGGLIGFMKLKRQVKAWVRISEKEYRFITSKVEGKKIKVNYKGRKMMWAIRTKPDMFHAWFGLVPFYFCEVGKAETSPTDDVKTSILTADELALIEEQSILKAFLSHSTMSAENIMLLLGAVGIGCVAGIIIGKFLFKCAVG